jgi:hypothetical protein
MREVIMLSSHFQCGVAIRFGLALFLLLGVNGCRKAQYRPATRTVTFECGDQTVGVVTGTGTSPKAVYLCGGDRLTWIPNGQKFTVTFKREYPFTGNPQVFTNNPANPDAPVTSPPAQYTGLVLIVYHYEMTINGKVVDDPQVIGGGGHTLYTTP